MITLGFAAGYCDVVTIDTALPLTSMYLYVNGTAGDIVFENSAGQAQYFPNAQAGILLPLAASRVVSAATVNGTPRTTTATDIVYMATGKAV